MCPAIFSYLLPSASPGARVPLGRMTSSELSAFCPQTPGSICSKSPARSSLSFCPCIFWGRGLFSQVLGACCPLPDPSPLWVSAHAGKKATHQLCMQPRPLLDSVPPCLCSGPLHPRGAPVPAAHRGAGGPLSHAVHEGSGANCLRSTRRAAGSPGFYSASPSSSPGLTPATTAWPPPPSLPNPSA